MVRRAHANGDIYLGTYEGWYCPNEGFRNATDVVETARGTICPNHPDVPLQWLTERNWFFRLSAYQERLERHFAEHPDFVQPDYRRNEMLGFIRGGLEDFSISRERTPGGWGIPFPIAENGETALREDGIVGPGGGRHLRLVRRADQLHHGRRLPRRPGRLRAWWPADLHVIGKDIARFHTIFWPAMLWSAGLEAPRHVWVHGWLLAAGGERMSKSRGNFLDPNDFVAAFGADGARYVVLREVPFDRDAEVSWDSFVRRYNADLANDFGNLAEPDGVDDEPLPRGRAAGAATGRRSRPSAEAGTTRSRAYGDRLERCLLHEALAELWTFVGGREQGRRCREAVGARQGGQGGRRGRRRPAARRARRPPRGVPARSVWPSRRSCRDVAPRVLAQLGYGYDYGADGNGGPPILEQLVWGARAGEPGRVTAPEPLFPRLDVEPRPEARRCGRAGAARRLDHAGHERLRAGSAALVARPVHRRNGDRASAARIARCRYVRPVHLPATRHLPCPDAPGRLALPPQRRPLRGRRRPGPRRGPPGRRRADPRPGLERRLERSRARPRRALRLARRGRRRPPARRRQGR